MRTDTAGDSRGVMFGTALTVLGGGKRRRGADDPHARRDVRAARRADQAAHQPHNAGESPRGGSLGLHSELTRAHVAAFLSRKVSGRRVYEWNARTQRWEDEVCFCGCRHCHAGVPTDALMPRRAAERLARRRGAAHPRRDALLHRYPAVLTAACCSGEDEGWTTPTTDGRVDAPAVRDNRRLVLFITTHARAHSSVALPPAAPARPPDHDSCEPVTYMLLVLLRLLAAWRLFQRFQQAKQPCCLPDATKLDAERLDFDDEVLSKASIPTQR